MTGRYFDTARREILPHLPKKVSRLLDLGCGSGATVALVKEARAVAWAGGIEMDKQAAKAARSICDQVWEGDATALPFEQEVPDKSLDLVLCLDILEHLVDPWSMVRRLSPLLAPKGRLIVSVPNIRNWKFLWRLMALGDFRYTDAGLLDRTHLRFFVRETAIELVTVGHLDLVSVGSAQPFRFPEPRFLLQAASFGRLESVLTKQWLLVAETP